MPTLEELEDDEVMAEFVAGVQSKMKELRGSETCWCACHGPPKLSTVPKQKIEPKETQPILSRKEIDLLLGNHRES